MEFTKMHGLGNDFIFIDQFSFSRELDYPAFTRQVCHRQFGVGGDGIIVVLPSAIADAKMRIFNLDGSEAEMCGNGIRCFARYVYDQGYVKKDELRVETMAGVLTLQIIRDGESVQGVRVDMGEPILEPKRVPVQVSGLSVIGQTLKVNEERFTYTAVSMGNPHCVIFIEDLDALDFARFGPAIEKLPLFPRKTNVEFVRVESPQEITVKVWERGAGPTLACGTGACASVVAAVLNEKTGREVRVHLPGGDLEIEWSQNNHIYMTGPAEYVFTGSLPDLP